MSARARRIRIGARAAAPSAREGRKHKTTRDRDRVMDSAIRIRGSIRAPCKRAGIGNCRRRTNSPESWVYFPSALFFGTEAEITLATRRELFRQPRQLRIGPIRNGVSLGQKLPEQGRPERHDGLSFRECPPKRLPEESSRLDPDEQVRELGQRCRYPSKNLVASKPGEHRTIAAVRNKLAEGVRSGASSIRRGRNNAKAIASLDALFERMRTDVDMIRPDLVSVLSTAHKAVRPNSARRSRNR